MTPEDVKLNADVVGAIVELKRSIEYINPSHEVKIDLEDMLDRMDAQIKRMRSQDRPKSEHTELTWRRAEFVYDAARLAAIAALAPIIPEPWSDREDKFVFQFLDVIEKQCGPDRSGSPEKLHEEWVIAYSTMGWVHGDKRSVSKKTHPDMVHYRELGRLEQDKDSVFVALCEIARLWIYDMDEDFAP